MKYNDKYKNVTYEGQTARCYDKTKVSSFDALFSETQIKLIELVKTYNFKLFFFTCKAVGSSKISIQKSLINVKDEGMNEVKNKQAEDMFFFYQNNFCEIFYSFNKLDAESNYYFDFLLVVKNDNNIETILKQKFKLIEIISHKEITLKEITHELFHKYYWSRSLILNNQSFWTEKICFDYSFYNYSIESFIKEKEEQGLPFEPEDYFNFNSFYYYRYFNQNEYAKSVFRLLCAHIWSNDQTFYKEKNEFGIRLETDSIYKINTNFVTMTSIPHSRYLMHLGLIDFTRKEVYSPLCVFDHLDVQGISMVNFCVDLINDGSLDYVNMEFKDTEIVTKIIF